MVRSVSQISRKLFLMTLSKRIIACLDVKNGRTVKGIQFNQLRDQGDPVELARKYASEGADELLFLDISATGEGRKTLCSLVSSVAAAINIPFTVGGGISSVEDVERLLDAGCDKISINSSAVRNPELINQLAQRFGRQCVVVAIDALQRNEWFEVMIQGGMVGTGRSVLEWAREAEQRGAGEILLTSIDNDGQRNGFALELTRQVAQEVSVPVIASGGGGTAKHFKQAFEAGKADAALAAGIFHEGVLPIPELKMQLRSQSILVR